MEIKSLLLFIYNIYICVYISAHVYEGYVTKLYFEALCTALTILNENRLFKSI